jgi:hypothetical protein
MSDHVAVLRTRYGKTAPIAGDEVKALAGKLPNVRTEPCSAKDGELDLVVLRDEAPAHRFVLQQGELRTRHPTHEALQVMINIAGQLAARLRVTSSRPSGRRPKPSSTLTTRTRSSGYKQRRGCATRPVDP